MTDDERVQREVDAQALSDELQRRLWVVVNDPAVAWATLAPHCVAHALGNMLTEVLVVLAATNPHDVQFGLWLTHQIEAQFIAQATPETARPTH